MNLIKFQFIFLLISNLCAFHFVSGQNLNTVVNANFFCLNDQDISGPGDPIDYSSAFDNFQILKVSPGEEFPLLYGITDIDRITNFSTGLTKEVVNVGLYKFSFDVNPPIGVGLSYNGFSGIDHLEFEVKGNFRLEDIRTKVTVKIPDPWNSNYFGLDVNIKEIENLLLPPAQSITIIDNNKLFQSYTVQKRTTCASEIVVDTPTDIYSVPQNSPFAFNLRLKNNAPPAYEFHFIEEKFKFIPLFSVSDITSERVKQVKAAL
jgi:hypothetical protein